MKKPAMTLIEVVVATGIFAFAAMMAVGAFSLAVRVQDKFFAQRNINQQARQLINQLAYDIRQATGQGKYSFDGQVREFTSLLTLDKDYKPLGPNSKWGPVLILFYTHPQDGKKARIYFYKNNTLYFKSKKDPEVSKNELVAFSGFTPLLKSNFKISSLNPYSWLRWEGPYLENYLHNVQISGKLEREGGGATFEISSYFTPRNLR